MVNLSEPARALTVSARSSVDPFVVMEVVRQAFADEARGKAVHHLEVGQPGTGAPQTARDAVIAMMQAGEPLGYTNALGIDAFRARVAQHYHDSYRTQIAAERVVATSGSSGGFMLSFLAAFDVGDRVALATPSYPAYRNTLKALGLNVVELRGQAETGYQLTPAMIEDEVAANGALQGVIVASPANPTGSILSVEEQQALVDCCATNGIRLLADEIYHGVSYDKPTRSFAEISDEVIVLNSFSKYFCMTGWRIGWLILPEALVKPVERLAQNLFICPPAIAQRAAIAAFDGTQELDGHLESYARNRARLVDAIEQCQLGPFVDPEGAFYLYVDISDWVTGVAGG